MAIEYRLLRQVIKTPANSELQNSSHVALDLKYHCRFILANTLINTVDAEAIAVGLNGQLISLWDGISDKPKYYFTYTLSNSAYNPTTPAANCDQACQAEIHLYGNPAYRASGYDVSGTQDCTIQPSDIVFVHFQHTVVR